MATGALDCRRLLLASLAAFVAGNLLAGLAHGYAMLMASRLAMALAAATFMPAASAYAAAVAAPERRGRALAIIYTGFTLAMAIGAPLGVIVGHHYGWRLTFVGVAGFATLAMIGLRAVLGPTPSGATVSLSERLAVARRPDVLAVLLSTTLVMSGVFTVYTYLAPFRARPPGSTVRLWPWCSSRSGWVRRPGTCSAARPRIASDRGACWGWAASLVVVFALFSLVAHTLPPPTARPLLVALISPCGAWRASPSRPRSRVASCAGAAAGAHHPVAQRLGDLRRHLPGAVIGSLVVRSGHLTSIGWVGLLCELAALGLVQLAWLGAPASGRAPVATTL